MRIRLPKVCFQSVMIETLLTPLQCWKACFDKLRVLYEMNNICVDKWIREIPQLKIIDLQVGLFG